ALPRLTGLPAPGPLDDEALAEFLTPEGRPSADQTLGGVTSPSRWENDPDGRRELARRALAGALRILGEGAEPRLFVLAEPGGEAMEVPSIVDVLLALAAGRDTATLEELHALWARDERLSAANVGDVIAARPAYHRVRAGETKRDDLLTLAGCSLGQVLLRGQ